MMRKSLGLFFAAVMLAGAPDGPEKPNLLWLTSEDNSIDWIGCYSNPHAETPHLDRLAREGFRYTQCHANVPVCAPQRSTWITGVHAISMGTLPMRSRNAIPHDRIRYYPDLLRTAGYYCSNVRKTDYNIGGRGDSDCWDASKLDWKILKGKQPFFQVLNTTASHESKAFGDVEKTSHPPDSVRLAKYHPDLSVIRKNYAHYHDAVKRMDADMGAWLKALEEHGLAENTIVVYCSDHGGVLPRSKRFLYGSGTHCPMIVRIPEKFRDLWPAERPGMEVDRLVSFIDMPKTWLSLAGAEVPDVLQGKIFLGSGAEPERRWHVSTRERMDERCDNARAIRDKRWLYIRNYMPYAPWGQHLNYLWKMQATRAWEAHHKEGKTDAVTGRWFRPKAVEELYDTSADPDNAENLAGKPEHAGRVAEMRAALRAWQLRVHDSAMLPEAERIRRAAKHGVTIYEMVRDPKLYDLEAYLDASDLALACDPSNLEALQNLLDNDDSGVRYWGMVGIFLVAGEAQSAQDRIRRALEDECHEVRAMAAWTLRRQGRVEESKAAFNALLAGDTPAALLVLNIIDWIGEGVEDYRDAIAACRTSHGGYVGRMKQYFGIQGKVEKKKKRAK